MANEPAWQNFMLFQTVIYLDAGIAVVSAEPLPRSWRQAGLSRVKPRRCVAAAELQHRILLGQTHA